jgi:hypothetical protein
MNADTNIARRNTLSKWAFEQSHKCKSSYFQELIDTVEFFHKQARFVQPSTIQLLREIEIGGVVYDHDDTMPHIFTCIDTDDRVLLRDSGRILLFAIDCDIEQFMEDVTRHLDHPVPLVQSAPHDLLRTVANGHFVQSKFLLEFA